jgi:mannose-6-phosphate isomerase-like protein (cupin superfamily)
MTEFHHRKLPEESTLLMGQTPQSDVGFQSQHLQIWYNNTDISWIDDGEQLHMHTDSDECFIVLQGTLIVRVDDKQYRIGPREFCCFPCGTFHGIVEIQTPIETLMIRAPSIKDKVYKESQISNE